MKSSFSRLFAAFALASLAATGSAFAGGGGGERPGPSNPGAFVGVKPQTIANNPTSCAAGFHAVVIDQGHFTCTSAPATCLQGFRADDTSERARDGTFIYECYTPSKYP